MTKPVPTITPLSAPFWKAAAEGELKMQCCSACGHIRFPIGPVCTKCLSPEATWVPVARKAKVLSHLVFHRGYTADWKAEVPYSVVMLQLPDGPRLFLDVLDPEKRHIAEDLVGREADIVFEPLNGDMAIPRASVD